MVKKLQAILNTVIYRFNRAKMLEYDHVGDI